jgi:hypothetical protein
MQVVMRTANRSSLVAMVLLSSTALALGACEASPGGDDVGVSDDPITAGAAHRTYGVDYSWSRPSIKGIKKDGYTFVARYLSHDTTGKNLTRSEADDLHKEGLDIVLNWEYDSTAALSGYDQGVSDAKAAKKQASDLGAPDDTPLYFSIDFDAESDDQSKVESYFEGVASVIGRARTGAYGGYYPVKHLFDEKKIDWAWQTYAWSDGEWDSHAQLRQIENDIGDGEDKDEARVSDFGQWRADTKPKESLGEKIAKLAKANLDKKACSENSEGSKDFDSSCTGDDGKPEYWCADFARWVWAKAGVTETKGLTAAAGSFYTYGKSHGTVHSEPAIGDAVVFDYKGDGVADHVAIVTKVDSNGDIETVSGDWDGDDGSESHFASTSHVRLNSPAYSHEVGSEPKVMGMKISGFIAPATREARKPNDDCFSDTLGKDMPPNACVQSRSNSLWYQCDDKSWVDRWTDPHACDGVHPL